RYFRALPESQKVVSLEDLTPLIELFHHMAKAGKYDEAFNLFYGRMYKPCFYRFSAYHLIIELLMEILPGGEIDGRMSLLKEAAYQACTLNYLANSYSLSGQPTNAVPLYLLNNKLQEKDDNKKNLAIGLGNAAGDQMSIGQLSTASGHLRKNIAFDREIKDEFYETYGHLELGRLLAFQGRATTYGVSLNPSLDGSANAEEEFAKSTAYFEKTNNYQGLSVTSAYRSLSALMQVRLAAAQQGMENLVLKHSREALHQARQALTFSEETIKTQYPVPRDFVQAYWLLGEVLICYGMNRSAGAKNIDPLEFEILFYDEYFQWVVETEIVTTVKPLTAAGHCLHEAICRCRKANMVDIEPDILLALVRFDVAQNKPPDETLLKEAFEIALRSGYRRVLADLHLFCGQVLLQFKDMKSLLGLTAVEHLQKTKEYALDVSDISHLYSPVKTTADDFYKGIPEYDMLKRGLTDEERIQNGYWVAYQIAETLLKESHSNATNTSVATNTDN
ncbi:MAG: hypothetical protein QG657_4400, partial [Acidobacteriota bacterium]|nr:hypothetical protein [Acidobacteriota bacterium]